MYGSYGIYSQLHFKVDTYDIVVGKDLAFIRAQQVVYCLSSKFKLLLHQHKNHIVSGLSLAHRMTMVSRPPENIRSTATAEPKGTYLLAEVTDEEH